MAKNLEPRKIWVNRTFQVKQYHPVQLYNEMVLVPTDKGKYKNEFGELIDSEEDAYLMLLETIHNVWDKYREMLKERKKNAQQMETE